MSLPHPLVDIPTQKTRGAEWVSQLDSHGGRVASQTVGLATLQRATTLSGVTASQKELLSAPPSLPSTPEPVSAGPEPTVYAPKLGS